MNSCVLFDIMAVGKRKGQRQGVKLTFFPGSHLAPKYFKVVANSKKLVAIMTHTHTHKKQFLPSHCTG